ncbi:MAG: inositol monophosphatase [Rhodospirillales bacterium]|nr:inositol monophosphatase [Rhodospirillales bacterium]
MTPDFDKVAQIIRATAAEEILPRFRRLTDADISKKRAGDVVTAVDLAVERVLARDLCALLPGSTVVGEEQAETDPGQFRLLKGAAPVWILDPIDGTQNFINGTTCFAVIVALCIDGTTRAGWIHAPVENETVWAGEGQGAWLNNARLRVAALRPIETMRGSVGRRTKQRILAKGATGRAVIPGALERYRCVGHEYMEFARGLLHFARYGSPLKPWDHAAGALISKEAGGIVALTEGRGAYDPAQGQVTADLLVATDAESWQSLERLCAED